jgi:hypothetical protein
VQAPLKTTLKTLHKINRKHTLKNRIKKQRKQMIGASTIKNYLKHIVQKSIRKTHLKIAFKNHIHKISGASTIKNNSKNTAHEKKYTLKNITKQPH